MNTKRIIFILIAVLSLAIVFTGCEGPMGPRGPAGESIQGLPGEDGQDGNADVDLYIFDGHDFENYSGTDRFIDDVTKEVAEESAWLVYLIRFNNDGDRLYYKIPGQGANGWSEYRTFHSWNSLFDSYRFLISLHAGDGEGYPEIRIIRIGINETIDLRTSSQTISANGLPANLDTSDYHAVVKYYGLE